MTTDESQSSTVEAQSEPGGAVICWCPDRCPITMRPFFMWIEHPELGEVPTYGGPFDSYTIPEPHIPDGKVEFHDIEFTCHRYDHDFGGWVEDEDPAMRVASESRLIDLGVWGA